MVKKEAKSLYRENDVYIVKFGEICTILTKIPKFQSFSNDIIYVDKCWKFCIDKNKKSFFENYQQIPSLSLRNPHTWYLSRPVWVKDDIRTILKCDIPQPLWVQNMFKMSPPVIVKIQLHLSRLEMIASHHQPSGWSLIQDKAVRQDKIDQVQNKLSHLPGNLLGF